MANLSITNVCNKECVYCFANDTLAEFGKTYLNSDTFERALDYLVRSGMKQARLLGGEPTLHPEFKSFVNRALARDLDIMLFSNGLISEKNLEFLSSLPEGRLSILLNTIHPLEQNNRGTNRQKAVMQRLGKVIIPGVNLYHANQELGYLLDYIADYGLKKEIRLGISHSVLSQKNIFLHPKEYHKIGLKIAKFKQLSNNVGVKLGLDCGFVPCMFPDEYSVLLSEEIKKSGNCCHPIIDMLTDGSFIACYPLNDFLKIQINDQVQAKELIRIFDQALNPFRNSGIYPHCSLCPLFQKRCNGGCVSFRIQRYQSTVDIS